VVGKHLYLQSYKKERQELTKWQTGIHTGRAGVANRSDWFEPSTGYLGVLKYQRLSTRMEYDSNLSHSLFSQPLV
jgi:hypothetical protein